MSDGDVPAVWIGTPHRGVAQEDVADPYTSKIGGQAMYFRVGAGPAEQQSAASLGKCFQCPQCKSLSQVSLLCQVYAPLEVYDRVLYVLTCAACARRAGATAAVQGVAAPAPAAAQGAHKKGGLAARSVTSYCFAVRSQNFSREYYAELQRQIRAEAQRTAAATAAKTESDAPLFDGGDDDWGDGADDWGTEDAPVAEPAASPAEAPREDATAVDSGAARLTEEPTYPLAPPGTAVPLKGIVYTGGLALDLFEEPPAKKKKELSVEEQLAVAESMYGSGAALDTSGFEEDDETPAETCVREYMEQMERTPSQCVRWCPGGTPLRTSTAPIGPSGAAAPPPCAACGAARQFEMQLTAPVVYYLTKDIGEAKNASLHFSNVLVYTCSKHCYTTTDTKAAPYVPEYVVVEDEL